MELTMNINIEQIKKDIIELQEELSHNYNFMEQYVLKDIYEDEYYSDKYWDNLSRESDLVGPKNIYLKERAKVYIQKLLHSINNSSENLFANMFYDNYENVKESFFNLINKNDIHSDENLISYGFKKEFLDLFVLDSSYGPKDYEKLKKQPIVRYENEYFCPIIPFFISYLYQNLSQCNQEFNDGKGYIAEKAISSEMIDIFSDYQESIYIYKNNDDSVENNKLEIDGIIIKNDIIFIFEYKGVDANKNVEKSVFSKAKKQTKARADIFLSNGTVNIFDNCSKEKKLIKTINTNNIKIITCSIHIEDSSVLVNNYERENEYNFFHLSFIDLLMIFKTFKYEKEILLYFNKRSTYAATRGDDNFDETRCLLFNESAHISEFLLKYNYIDVLESEPHSMSFDLYDLMNDELKEEKYKKGDHRDTNVIQYLDTDEPFLDIIKTDNKIEILTKIKDFNLKNSILKKTNILEIDNIYGLLFENQEECNNFFIKEKGNNFCFENNNLKITKEKWGYRIDIDVANNPPSL